MIQLTIGTGSCPSQRGHDDYPTAEADRGRHPGLLSFNVLAGGPGYPRIVNGIIDIGAFEVQAPAASNPTRQPLPDPLPVQALGMAGGPLLGQLPTLPADSSSLPEPSNLDAPAGQSEPVAVPTATGQQAPATSFGIYPGTAQALASLGSLSASDLDPLAQELLGGP